MENTIHNEWITRNPTGISAARWVVPKLCLMEKDAYGFMPLDPDKQINLPFLMCNYCGSIHPERLSDLIKAGVITSGIIDPESYRKYGRPYIFFVRGYLNPFGEEYTCYKVEVEQYGKKEEKEIHYATSTDEANKHSLLDLPLTLNIDHFFDPDLDNQKIDYLLEKMSEWGCTDKLEYIFYRRSNKIGWFIDKPNAHSKLNPSTSSPWMIQ